MVGIIEGFRWTLLGLSPPGAPLVVSVVMAVAVLVSGLCYFTRTERSFADIL
jgi:lipopolysaccharide transport system permease protein